MGGLVIVISILLSSAAKSVFEFYLFYAFGFGLGKGFIYSAALQAGWSHLPGRKGFVTGIIVSGIGVGAFFYGLLGNYLVNPDNV